MSIESVMPSNCLLLCRPLLLPPSIFPSIRVFSNESVLRIKWPKYWSFSFNISPPKEYSGLIFFRMDWWDLLAVQGNLNSLLQDFSTRGIEGHLTSWGTGGLGTEIRQWMSWDLMRRGGLGQGLRPQRGTQREPCGETRVGEPTAAFQEARGDLGDPGEPRKVLELDVCITFERPSWLPAWRAALRRARG